MKKLNSYHAYLLRCWQENDADDGTQTWRFSLEAVHDNRRYGFANLETLLAFLRQTTQQGSD